MSSDERETEPVEALLDLLLYAPLGLVTQLDELLPGLIERGRSQAAMARMVGEFAVRAGSQKVQGRADETQRTLENAARTILGVLSGLVDRSGASTATSQESSSSSSSPTSSEAAGDGLPIENYDTLKATEIIPLLDALDAGQRASIESHERAGRSRKTILHRLAQLAGS
jgi:hypothetical protein